MNWCTPVYDAPENKTASPTGMGEAAIENHVYRPDDNSTAGADKATNPDPDLTEARNLFNLGFKLCKLERHSKQPNGKDWNLKPIREFDESATGYGIMLAANDLCSIDPDDYKRSRTMLAGLGFDLDALLDTGVRSASTRPGSGGRSTFKAAEGLRWIRFAFHGGDVVLELRANSSNLQDVIPGLTYYDKSGELRTQRYANCRRIDEAPELPTDFLTWWRHMSDDVEYLRAQQRKAGEILGIAPTLAISGGSGKSLAFSSSMRQAFNEANAVPDILIRHGYSGDGVRYAPATASGKAGVREIPGKDGLWQSDHASDPLFGMFDAWTAYVVLDHDGDQTAAEAAMLPAIHAQLAEEFDDLGPVPDSEKPRRKFELIDADDFSEGPAPEWIVRGVLPRAELAVIYGESGSGKSFFALDLAAAVARGIEWRGCRVRQGQVIYVAAEGSGGFRKRLKAYRKHHGASLRGLVHVLAAAPNLLTDDDKHLAEAINAVGNAAVIVVDTLAQTTPGANENAGEDMGKVLAHCKRLHATTGALVLLIHHSGKDVTKGARGWSGIRAAVDAEIEITRLVDTRIARVSKQKDGDDGAMFAFKLLVVPLGMDEDGEAITSCVVEHQDTVPVRVKVPSGKNQKIAWACGHELIEPGNDTFTMEELVAAMIPKMEHDPGKKDKRREHALRAISNMIESGFFYTEGGRIEIPQNPK